MSIHYSFLLESKNVMLLVIEFMENKRGGKEPKEQKSEVQQKIGIVIWS